MDFYHGRNFICLSSDGCDIPLEKQVEVLQRAGVPLDDAHLLDESGEWDIPYQEVPRGIYLGEMWVEISPVRWR